MGKRMSLKWYSFRCHTFTCKGLCGPVLPPGSIEIPIVHATFLWVLATLNSYKLKPLPAHSLVWYLTMGHLTKDWMAPDMRWRAMWHVGSLGLVPSDLPCHLVEPHGCCQTCGSGVQDQAIPAGHHGCCLWG